ncbi:MAG TPA: lipoate--protein ligase family protein, partial [Firmicutes bacterium]|nr:lipoate--protein ligase family protein [Bacillota bacterium]
MTSWRLLDTGARGGSENMAIDEALFTGVISGYSPPTLRFFTWEPACLSLGFRQQAGVRLLAACRRHQVEVVCRPTGGLAALHGEDLCYSVTTRLGEGPFPAALQQANLKINQALRAGLRLLGLPAE